MCIGCSRRVNGWGFRGKCERKLGDARGKHEVGGKGGEGGWGNREMRRGGRGEGGYSFQDGERRKYSLKVWFV